MTKWYEKTMTHTGKRTKMLTATSLDTRNYDNDESNVYSKSSIKKKVLKCTAVKQVINLLRLQYYLH